MSGPSPAAETIACLVIYKPDWDDVRATIGRIAPELSRIILYANSPVGEEEPSLAGAAHPTPLSILGTGANDGLGRAYNAALHSARQSGDAFLLLLDQDSIPPAGMISQLKALLTRLQQKDASAALIGPYPVDLDGRRFKLPHRSISSPPVPGVDGVEFLISSGTLLSVPGAIGVGDFDEDFFIDAVDIEWCMRAWAKGRSAWVATDIEMPHRLGRGVIALPFGLRLADQPDERLYTYMRNQFAMLSLAHVPLWWKAKFLVSLPLRCIVYLLRSDARSRTMRALALGAYHGVLRRLGSPQAVWQSLRTP